MTTASMEMCIPWKFLAKGDATFMEAGEEITSTEHCLVYTVRYMIQERFGVRQTDSVSGSWVLALRVPPRHSDVVEKLRKTD